MSQQTTKCSNCRAHIAENVSALHEIYCIRNNIECKRCGQFFDKNDPESHEEEYHKGTACEHCKQIFADISKHSNCSKKPVQCIHCKLDQQKDTIFQHENMCGSRTEKCEICKQYVMIRELTNHQLNCVIKPKEVVQEKYTIPNNLEQKYVPQSQPFVPSSQDYSNIPQTQNISQKPKQQYIPQMEKEHQMLSQQIQAKHEIFGYEKPSNQFNRQQQKEPSTKIDRPTDIREQLYPQNRQVVQQPNQPYTKQLIVDSKYKQKEAPLQPTNGIKRPSSNLPENRNIIQQNGKYIPQDNQFHKYQERKVPDARQNKPNIEVTRQNEMKRQDIKPDYLYQDQNIRQQHRNISQQQPQKPQTNAIEEEIDYMALGLTKEEIQQQKAYLESIEQNRKVKEPQLSGQEYKPRSDYQARGYERQY